MYVWHWNHASYSLPRRCRHFVKYEGATTTIGINIAALMMLLRIRALYWNENKLIVALVGAIFAAEAGTNAWLLVYGSRGWPLTNLPFL